MTREVAIIGCGPAGLLAAHAAVLADYQPVIFSKSAEPSPTARATFLHRAIPDITAAQPDGVIKLKKVGTESGYARKVYGDPFRRTSWSRFVSNAYQPAWALAPAYETLWRLYGGTVQEAEIDPEEAHELVEDYPLAINTAPAPALCGSGHEFESRALWVVEQAPDEVGSNTMVYNGYPPDHWSRASDIFGIRSTEYTKHSNKTVGAHKGMKVVSTDCDCHPKIHRAGRWGTWRQGVLVHQAFEYTFDLLRLDRAKRDANAL